MRLHDLRHTAATLMMHRAVDPYRVVEYFRHDVKVCLEIYTRVHNSENRRRPGKVR